MDVTRREALTGLGAAVAGGAAIASSSRWGPGGDGASAGDGVGAAIAFDEAGSLAGLSDVVRVESVPAVGEDPDGDGSILHVTSLPEDGSDGDGRSPSAITNDYGISVVDVAARELTLADLARPAGGGLAGDTGVSHEWLVTERNVVGVDTDHERVGVGPDEIWFVLGDADAVADDRTPIGAVMAGEATALFGTKYADVATGEWHTRTVAGELRGDDAVTWRTLSVAARSFVPVDAPVLEAFGDASVLAVGVGRGDPHWGPSVHDAYYRELRVADRPYQLPDGGLQWTVGLSFLRDENES